MKSYFKKLLAHYFSGTDQFKCYFLLFIGVMIGLGISWVGWSLIWLSIGLFSFGYYCAHHVNGGLLFFHNVASQVQSHSLKVVDDRCSSAMGKTKLASQMFLDTARKKIL